MLCKPLACSCFHAKKGLSKSRGNYSKNHTEKLEFQCISKISLKLLFARKAIPTFYIHRKTLFVFYASGCSFYVQALGIAMRILKAERQHRALPIKKTPHSANVLLPRGVLSLPSCEVYFLANCKLSVISTSSPTTAPPASVMALQVRPKDLRLIVVVALKPALVLP